MSSWLIPLFATAIVPLAGFIAYRLGDVMAPTVARIVDRASRRWNR